VGNRRVWLLVAVVCLAAVAGCGSESTGVASADAVRAELNRFGGPEVKTYVGRAYILDAQGRAGREVPLVIACKPGGGCEIIAPDGVAYPDLQHFVDDSKFVEDGDEVLANPNLLTPEADPDPHLESYTRSAPVWPWYAGGGALTLVLVLGALWLVRRRRSRAAPDETPTDG
jgi:hypothetical protein